MKIKSIFLLIPFILFGCSGPRFTSHPTVKKAGVKSHKESQNMLSRNFGGANYKSPNKFKKNHF